LISSTSSNCTPRRILLASSDAVAIELYQDHLAELDCDYLTATSGADALRCVRQFAPPLILLDALLAGIDGINVCRQVKSNPSTRRTMILMISSFSGRGEIELAVDAETDDFLCKPVNKIELLRRVENLLRLHALS
jgi:two-component system, OmpR family, alkaline phosphatase synthesis response regulator PhoP